MRTRPFIRAVASTGHHLAAITRITTVTVLLGFPGLLFVVGVSPTYGQAGGANDSTVGTPWAGAPGHQETTAEIMARQEQIDRLVAGGTAPPALKLQPPPWTNRAGLPQNPASAALDPKLLQAGVAAQPGGIAPQALAPQTLGVNFTGATLTDAGFFPPDSMGAVGPTQFLVGINGRVRTFSKITGTADGALNASTNAFFASVLTPPTSNNVASDPRVRYDRLSGRWIVIMIDVPGEAATLPNRVMIAVSDGSTITLATVWTFFYFQHDQVTPTGDTNQFADYPTLGVDANALYIGVNVFSTATGQFLNCTAFIVRKSSVLGAGPIVVTAFRGLIGGGTGPFTPQGVDNYDPAATQGYFVGTSSNSFGTLILRRVDTPGGVPSISGNISIAVASTALPITVPHLGNTGGSNGRLSPVDDRLFAAHIRNGRLWTAHNIGVNGSGVASSTPSRVAVRWYELQNLSGVPSVAQSGTIFDSAATNPLFYWIPSVIVSGQGHAAFGFSVAGNNAYADAATTGMLLGSSVQPPVAYTSTASAYNPPGDLGGSNGRRWGDYSYTSLDPSDDMTMWTIQEFTSSTNIWGVRVAQLLAPAPALNNPAVSVCRSQSNHVVPLTGTGFYDPGTGFANHLAVSVSGAGVTVTSVTYNTPLSAAITVSVAAAAAPGPRDITLTNPDGQSAIAIGGLTVGSGVCPDFDADGDVDLTDFGHFQSCFNGPNRPPAQPNCSNADFDGDTDVDLSDFGVFQSCFNGPNRPPACS